MNIHQSHIRWKDFKQGVRSLWDLTDSEIEASGGDIYKLENIIMNKYQHESPIIIQRMMQQLIDSYENPTDHDPRGLYQTSYERRPPSRADL
ncbi:MAG TPA: hypothetical protein VKY27_07020 [Bacteriovoracaceae bacterium]|nr:hypothetical protein [Bacteriovoracaceae bacterium]